MPDVYFTTHLRHILGSDGHRVEAPTVRAAIEAVFVLHPVARGYILDDQGRLRQHVVVFCEGQRVDPAQLDQPVEPEQRIDVLQALSGG